jgi:2-keto-4-pentenoate hydratase/2-oxohepta-3-ene-1,7-dioic acid hydratase in catechol pathway
MKIVRFSTLKNETMYGVWEGDDGVRVIAGDPFGIWAVSDTRLRLEQVTRILPPVAPPNIFCIGMNYRAHAEEGGAAIPDHPVVFIKSTNALNSTDMPIILPKSAPNEVDYEAEVALVIGRTAFEVSEEDAFDYLFGYTAANDVSARDCQLRIDQQWARGKSFDTFCPLGPFIQTEGDPDNIRVSSRVNGETMQDSSTDDLIFSCRNLISYLSHQFTLYPGTLILTGTPSGVGFVREPPVLLKDGDKVEVEVEGVGVLSNPVVAA